MMLHDITQSLTRNSDVVHQLAGRRFAGRASTDGVDTGRRQNLR